MESELSCVVRDGVFLAWAMSSRPARSASDEKFISWEMGTKRHESTPLSEESPTVDET